MGKAGNVYNRQHHLTKSFVRPEPSVELAEFCGILLGDGGITPNQVRVTLNRIDEPEYVRYVTDLMEKLFCVAARVYPSCADASCDICLSRVGVVRLLTQELGLMIGNKVRQQVRVPYWIADRPDFADACVRGLFDTDGTVITHRYRSKGKLYSYKKLAYTSCSMPLIEFVSTVLAAHSMRPRIASHGKDVRLDSRADVARYFKVIGTHNAKHLNRYGM